MQKDDSIQFEELDQILRTAQLRRTADVGGWLRQYFENRRQARLQKHARFVPATGISQTTG